ncbi:inositol polyphosphate 5-phosphatase K-like [Mytilus edulis]|uniref:inositol polyphosphate 5-phosphatase K-like n=1 Tax=Mytilus edulis TaxID=6550 RepID=UPI0039F0F52A
MSAQKIKTKTKTFRLYMVTWNVGDRNAPTDFTELLKLDQEPLPNTYAVGLQEMTGGDDHVYNDWTKRLTEILNDRGYFRLKSVRMQAILLVVFVKREDILSFTHIQSEISRAGMGGWWGNKGAVSVRFDVNGVNMIIVNAHLAAHMDNVRERIEDFHTILRTQKFRDKDVDHILDHDYIFFMGDLNFRLQKVTSTYVERAIRYGEYKALMEYDQLLKCMEEDLIFVDFLEGQITFPPTYKFDPGTDKYDTSAKKRLPAYCDRILWHVHEDSFENIELDVKQLSYESHMSYKLSDHKPVSSLFEIQIYSSPPIPLPVRFLHIKSSTKWTSDQEEDVHYKFDISPNLEYLPDKWDWIGLYKENFRSIRDQIAYVYIIQGAKMNKDGCSFVTFHNLSLDPGKYRLLYISEKKDTLLGISEVFQVVK